MDITPPNVATLKICNRCRRDVPTAEFWGNKRSKDGLRSKCIDCCRIGYQELKVSRNNRCPDCNTLISPYRSRCGSCSNFGERSPRWKSGREKDPKGYIVLTGMQKVPGSRKGGQMPEHKYLMQQDLGRPLTSDETVHHKNGIRNDNRLDNLELWSTSQPSGQRVSDKLEWAYEFILKYRHHPEGSS